MNEFLEKVKKTVFKKNTPLPSDRDVIIQLVSDEMKKLSNKVDYRFKKLEDSQINVSKTFLKLGEKIMADLNQVKAAIADLKATVTDEASEVSNELALLNATVAELQAQLANGSAVSAADLDEVLASINGVSALVEGIIETASPVEPAPVDTPTEEPLAA